MPRFASVAEQCRRARENFEMARQLGLSCPAEAECERRRIEARERNRAAQDRLAARMAPAPAAPPTTPERSEPWMMRD